MRWWSGLLLAALINAACAPRSRSVPAATPPVQDASRLANAAPAATVGQPAEPELRLVQTIPLPGVESRIDHLALDPARQRLYLAALGNGSLEVVDLAAGRRLSSLAGFAEPSGVALAADAQRLALSTAGTGRVELLDAGTLAAVGRIGDLPDADNVRYDAGLLYIGYGDGGLARLRAGTGQRLAAFPLSAHPEAFVLEPQGRRMFVNLAGLDQVAVLDRESGQRLATWELGGAHSNFPMALDAAGHRLFVGCRRPASLVVLSTDDGHVVDRQSLGGDTDDVWYDAARHRVYASCGSGVISVLAQADVDHYQRRPDVTTASGARTSLWAADSGRLYLAVPHRGEQAAEVRVYAAP